MTVDGGVIAPAAVLLALRDHLSWFVTRFSARVVAALPVLAAQALRNRRSYVQLLLEGLELAERSREEKAQRRADQQRLRIARDPPDVVAQTRTTSNVQSGVAVHLLDREPTHARTALATIEAASHAHIC